MILTDLSAHWKARPFRNGVLVLIVFSASALLGWGLKSLQEAEQQAAQTLKLWPDDQTTVILNQTPDWQTYRQWTKGLPQEEWFGYRIHNQTAVWDGTFTSSFPAGLRSPVFANTLRQGVPVALTNRNPAGTPGTLEFDNQSYRIRQTDLGTLPANQAVHLNSLDTDAALPDRFKLHMSYQRAKRLTARLLQDVPHLVIDHGEQKEKARINLNRLQLKLQLTAIAIGALVSLIMVSTWISEMNERKTEFALRRSVGATRRNISTLVMAESLSICTPSIAAGLLLFSGSVSSVMLGAGFAIMLTLVLISAWIPAQHASSQSPAEVLKHAQ